MTVRRRKAWLAWSSGKDSAWALHVLRADPDVEVVGLLTTVNSRFDRVSMHGVRGELLRAQAAAVALPLLEVPIPFPCTNRDYEVAMQGAMAQAVSEDIEVMAFGDLFLQDVRHYRETRMRGTGIEPRFPLWGRRTDGLILQMLTAGLRARITCVDPNKVDPYWAGRELDEAFLAALSPDVDPCGERGEFHTFVHDGPLFIRPVDVMTGEVIQRDGFVFADLLFLGHTAALDDTRGSRRPRSHVLTTSRAGPSPRATARTAASRRRP